MTFTLDEIDRLRTLLLEEVPTTTAEDMTIARKLRDEWYVMRSEGLPDTISALRDDSTGRMPARCVIIGDFAVHPSFGWEYRKLWTVTHVQSGASISVECRTRDEAERMARAIIDLKLRWDFSDFRKIPTETRNATGAFVRDWSGRKDAQ